MQHNEVQAAWPYNQYRSQLQQQLDRHCLTAELLLPAITRVVGIIGGVLLSLLLSVLLWPKSASEQAMRYELADYTHSSMSQHQIVVTSTRTHMSFKI